MAGVSVFVPRAPSPRVFFFTPLKMGWIGRSETHPSQLLEGSPATDASQSSKIAGMIVLSAGGMRRRKQPAGGPTRPPHNDETRGAVPLPPDPACRPR